MKILVTGMGIISPLGFSPEDNFHALRNKRCGITEIENLTYMRKRFLGGEIKRTNDELKEQLKISGDVHRSILFGYTAAQQAWGVNRIMKGVRTGLIHGTTVGGVDLNDQLLGDNPERGDDKLDYAFVSHGYGAGFIGERLNIRDYRATISTACSTAANSILVGARMISHGLLDRVLVGGADSITNYTLNGFDSLALYDTEICKPFDEQRKGLNLGEGSGYLLLESEESATRTGNERIAELVGWANTSDAFHQTASSPNGIGATLGMNQAIFKAGIKPENIGYINMHGTGTPNNDSSECKALQAVFGDQVPAFNSTKAYTGHTLAAAGSIEAIHSISCLQNGEVFPSINVTHAMSEFSFSPNTVLQKIPHLRYAMSSSFGFGGNCTVLVFKK